MTTAKATRSAKKTPSRKKAPAKASASALPPGGDIPEGFEQIGGGYAPTWKVEDKHVLHGAVTGGVRIVELTIGRKKQERRCLEITEKKTGDRFTVWESAALGDFFDQIQETGEGAEVFLRFDGYGNAKKGQNPPKLFTVAMKA